MRIGSIGFYSNKRLSIQTIQIGGVVIRRWYDDLRTGDHVVHVYGDDADELKVVLDLIHWMGDNDKFVYLSDRWNEDGSMAGSSSIHPLIDAALKEGRFEVLNARSYLYGAGKIRSNAITDLLVDERTKALNCGFEALLIGWDGTWAFDIAEDLEQFLLYEALLSSMRLPTDLTIFCQYDGRRMSSELSAKVSSMHQLVLSDGRLVRNYWVISTGGAKEGLIGSRQTVKQGQVPIEQSK